MEKKKRLYFCPKRAPKWWPREAGKKCFVGAFKDGIGWMVGKGDLLTADELRWAKRMLRENWAGCEFRVD